VVESRFEMPLEVSDLMMSNPNYTPRWMVCLRSTKTEETKRLTRSVFFSDQGYVFSRYSAIMDGCSRQSYHTLKL
jgi:hypothetical protein